MGRKKSNKPKLSWRMQQFIKNPRASRIRARRLSKEETLTEDFMRQYADYLDWDEISYHQQLSEEFCMEFGRRINWGTVLNRNLISETFLRNYQDDVKWEMVSRSHMNFSRSFLREFENKIDWRGYIYAHYDIPQDIVEEFIDKFDCINLMYRAKLDEKFIRKYICELSKAYSFWNDVTARTKVSEQFLRDYADKIDWRNASYTQTLSEELIDEFKDKVDWKYITQKQTLSEQFIKNHINHILTAVDTSWGWREMMRKQKLGKRFIKKYANKINWYDVKRDFDYIKNFGGTKYASKIDEKFIDKMIEKDKKTEEVAHKKSLKELCYTW